jgi:ABC-type transporter Mla MlaB component
MPVPSTFKLPEECSIRTIRTLHGDLGAAFARTSDLTLDCTDVARADIAFVQLIVSAAGTASRQAKSLRLAHVPDVVLTAFRRSGVSPENLECPVF